ncbi:hypothetical protein KAR91_28605 [Candidatus Pacearchaeota archaeon]|nr:hypothetical protein [Candidatus Pacearchaeota archaeon]
MMKVALLLIILSPSICFAEVSGYLFLSKYLNHEQTDLEGRDIAHKTGVYLEIKSKWPTLFVKEETLIRDIVNGASFPKQINYTIGVKHKYKAVEVILTHKCLHPVDGTSGGKKAKDYNLIEGRINF